MISSIFDLVSFDFQQIIDAVNMVLHIFDFVPSWVSTVLGIYFSSAIALAAKRIVIS